jgi:hypothetical protein
VGIWTDRNARSQRTIGTEEETKSNPTDAALPNTPDFLTNHNFLTKIFRKSPGKVRPNTWKNGPIAARKLQNIKVKEYENDHD